MAAAKSNKNNGEERKKLSVEELMELADLTAEDLLETERAEQLKSVVHDETVDKLARVASGLSHSALRVGRPEASVLLRLAAIQMAGTSDEDRENLMQTAISIIADGAA